MTPSDGTFQGPNRRVLALRLASHLQMKYVGTPVATIPSPIKACTGRATTVFRTMATAATMNRAGVTGYPGTRNGRAASGRRRRNTNTLAAASAANIQLANTT